MLSDAQQELFTRLWTAVQPAVAGYIRALVRDDPVADGLTQETALVLLRTFSSYDPQRPFLPWALNTAKFQILGHRRDEALKRILERNQVPNDRFVADGQGHPIDQTMREEVFRLIRGWFARHGAANP